MFIFTIQISREGTDMGRQSISVNEKEALIKGVSELLLNVLKLESTQVIFEEVGADNCGLGD